jgi:hypothetical protein
VRTVKSPAELGSTMSELLRRRGRRSSRAAVPVVAAPARTAPGRKAAARAVRAAPAVAPARTAPVRAARGRAVRPPGERRRRRPGEGRSR